LHTAQVRTVYLRGLALVHFIAFTSLREQVLGLVGARGIAPARELLDSARNGFGQPRLRAYPTIFWLDASDEALLRGCRVGQGMSLALLCGVTPRLTLFALWGLYLSFVTVCDELLAFQWDTLLLESTAHAFVVASPRKHEDTPRAAVLMMRAFVFRFFYEAGLAKLRSGDTTWKRLTACSYHYETQPLPTPLAWRAHELPPSIQRISTLGALAIECVVPFGAFAPRRIRRVAFGLLATLQTLIALTGNYGFFNVLSVVLAVWLLDDDALPRALGGGARATRRTRPARWSSRLLVAAGAALLMGVAVIEHVNRYGRPKRRPFIDRVVGWLAPLRSITAYGLFSVMTRQRPEIVIEGSNDGEHWLPYELRYKPGDPQRPSRFVAPHQPRLDWQMWFAAIESPPEWFFRLLVRLLEGEPEVLRLLDTQRSPFMDHPPKYIQAILYDYRMAPRGRGRMGERRVRWERRRLRTYVRPLMLAPAGATHDA
jgi:lipase maturation factor 1